MRRTVLVARPVVHAPTTIHEPRIAANERALMQVKPQSPSPTEEPMGIVISRGSRAEATPVFRAFEYGLAPEDDTPIRAPQAA